ncbi:MAG: ATP-binding protein [Calditrichaceae bacterium]
MKLVRISREKGITLRVILTFVIFSALWILISEAVLSVLQFDLKGYILFDTAKNLFFVIITSILLYILIYQNLLVIRKSHIAIRKSRLIYQTFFENTGAATIIVREDLSISLANSEFVRLSEYAKTEIEERMKLPEFIVENDWVSIGEYLVEQTKQEDSVPKSYETRMTSKTGKIRDILLNVALIPGTGRQVVSCLDITDLKHTEEALRKSEANNRALLNAIPDLMFRFHKDGTFLEYGVKKKEELLLSPDNFLGKKVSDILPAELVEKTMHHINQALIDNNVQVFEYQIPLKGKINYFESRLIKCGEDEVLAIVRNFTERVKAQRLAELRQKELMQADKMATLGVLVSGMAHEINNPNNFIHLNGKILSKVWDDIGPILRNYYESNGDFALAGMPYTKAHPKIAQLISGISEGAMRIQRIVQSLKDFARKDEGNLNQRVDINAVIESAIVITNNLINKSTSQFNIECQENLPLVRGNFQQLEQVIINLITNSCQAIQNKSGGINVITFYDDKKAAVIIKIIDEGPGISKKHLKRIMDPFYTTKRHSGGTGLGLSISYNIIREHDGDLIFDSQQKAGTTVTIVLPEYKEVLSHEVN